MTDEVQLDAFITPGTLLKTAREAQQLSEREVADRLNWMPGYTAIIERDDFQALRRPAFARGYVKAYGKMLGIDEAQLLAAFDQLATGDSPRREQRSSSRPVQLQRTGLGVVTGLVLLALLVLAIWWWRGEPETVTPAPAKEVSSAADSGAAAPGKREDSPGGDR